MYTNHRERILILINGMKKYRRTRKQIPFHEREKFESNRKKNGKERKRKHVIK